jgi:hypothetical protein
MPIASTYSLSPQTLSLEYTTISELLDQLPDNTVNLIDPNHIRDSVYTLWQRIDNVGVIAASAASASAFFENSDPTPFTVGGIPAGSTFPTPTDMQTMWNQLLYPYVQSGATITGGNTREFGSSTAITLNWTALKKSNDIQSIIVDGVPITGAPWSTDQSGFLNSFATLNTTTNFSIVVNDGTSNTTATTTVNWQNRRYWGRLDLSSIGNPNLTTHPGLASSVIPLVNDSFILSLIAAGGAGVATGSELSTSISKTYNQINANGWYLVFAWPSSFTNSQTPQFNVNGLPNTAFTRIRNNSPFTNQFGYTTNYEVWISNTLQNSPLNIIIS